MENQPAVPVWTLATEPADLPRIIGDQGLTQARLGELRTALAAFADAPIATLEAHPLSAQRDRAGGIVLHATSPLAQQLSQLVTQTAKSAPSNVNVGETGEVLYRMIVPAKVAAQFGEGLVKPMSSSAVAGGIHSALHGSAGIAAQATFVPVAGKAAVAGAATGSAATAGVAVASAGALTVAAPLVLMAVAVGVSAYADRQRQMAIEHITDLLEQLHDDNLSRERNELDACRDAIDKATSILLDKGKIGHSLGLDSASFAISKAVSNAKTRLAKWEESLAALPDGPVELATLTKAFPGINDRGGVFRTHLELARLAIALKRRVLVLEAVEHAQLEDTGNPFTRFVEALRSEERDVDELETRVDSVLVRLSSLELKRHGGIRIPTFTPSEVDKLLKSAYRLRALGDGLHGRRANADIAIEIERRGDGVVTVFPAVAA
ncbi:hypothetical protein [Agromyces sp. GXQ0307]|uniref:hypothetical protein n=1 Tax=Agromyces sp. GXQ0307 TaxID=3377835 RepID=UPI00383BB89F